MRTRRRPSGIPARRAALEPRRPCGNAPKFWSEIHRADEEAAATAKTKPAPQVDSEGRTIIAYDGADRIGKTSVIAREKDETDEQYRTRSAALKQLMAKPRPPGRRI